MEVETEKRRVLTGAGRKVDLQVPVHYQMDSGSGTPQSCVVPPNNGWRQAASSGCQLQCTDHIGQLQAAEY